MEGWGRGRGVKYKFKLLVVTLAQDSVSFIVIAAIVYNYFTNISLVRVASHVVQFV